MNTTKKLIVIAANDTDKNTKSSLLKTLTKKRRMLMLLTAKVEMLRMDLDIIKREYHVRIGNLYLKDDQLDLEIIHYKHLQSLLKDGLAYEEALKKVNEEYYAEKQMFQATYDEFQKDEHILDKRKKIAGDEEKNIKTVWKKLLFKLHPDLTTDQKEKKDRETIMKKINDAYTENDYDALIQIQNQHYTYDAEETSISSLEETINNIENARIALENEYHNLKESEWYIWKEKSDRAKRKQVDLFKELEEKLLEDIARKITIVQAFRAEFDKKGYY